MNEVANLAIYHQYVDHPFEDCWVFQNWMQREVRGKKVSLRWGCPGLTRSLLWV